MPEVIQLFNARRADQTIPDLYPSDIFLIEQTFHFESLLTDEMFYQLKREFSENGLPWISPLYFFPLFNLGLTRIVNTTPKFVLTQYDIANSPDDFTVAPAIAQNLMKEYNNLLYALRKIVNGRGANPQLVEVDETQLSSAEAAYAQFMESDGIGKLNQLQIPTLQKEELAEFVTQARAQVLGKIQLASQPVMDAGAVILNRAFELMGILDEQPQLTETHN